MVYLRNCLPVVLGGAVLMATVSPVLAKTPAEIQAVAKATTVKIEKMHDKNAIGTGVIIHKQGQVYSLITNRHVVCDEGRCNQLSPDRQYRLSLPDGQQVQVSTKNIKLLGQNLDLAVIQFSSSRSYLIARIAAPGRMKVKDAVFTAGFPLESRRFGFGEGEAIAVVNRRIQGDKGGYSVIYDAPTMPGMSGGGVFDQDGELVAIHGYGDRYQKNTDLQDQSKVDSKIGYNRGIPVRWLVQSLGEIGIIVGERQPLSTIRVSPNQKPELADEYFISGFNKFVEPGDNGIITGKKEAIQQFTKAIQLNPQYEYAYFVRAYAYIQIGDFSKALADYNQVITLNPNFTSAYVNRGNLKYQELNDFQGALADYNKAITLKPDFVEVYYNRGFLKQFKLNDPQGALADYNQVIALNPDSAKAYHSRGFLKQFKLNDFRGALADYNKAILINPDYAEAYGDRGTLKGDKLNDFRGALADYNKAITLKPDFVEVYYNRGNLKHQELNDPQGALDDYNKAIFLMESSANPLKPYFESAYYNRGALKHEKLNDPQGALSDYNKAISINPDHAEVYGNRGILKKNDLNDREGAIADLRQAAKLFREQGKAQYLQMAIEQLRSLGASE
jgi:tetratricopeptide (TPR) repeat protein